MASSATASRVPVRSSAKGPSRARRSARIALKWSGRLAPTASVLLALGLVANARLRNLHAVGWLETLGVAALAIALVARMARRFRLTALAEKARFTEDLELGALLIAAAYLMVEVLGATVYPVIYLLMAFLVAFLPRWSGVSVFGVALLFDAARHLQPAPRWPEFLLHAGFLALFASLYHLVLAARTQKAVADADAEVHRRLREIDDRARTYRLATRGEEEREAERKKWLRTSGVREVEAAVAAAMDLAETALSPHTCAVFMLTTDDKLLKLQDCRSQSERVQRQPLDAGEGTLGGVVKSRKPVRSCGAVKGITYYDSTPRVRSLIAVPLLEESTSPDAPPAVRGVIVADRLTEVPFTEDDERLLETAAREILRSMNLERVLNYAKSELDEKDALYRAMEKLNRTRLTSEAVEVAVTEAKDLGGFDFVALTLTSVDGGKRRHRVAKVAGAEVAKGLEGFEFPDNSGLVANVIRYRAPLPTRDARDMDQMVIFDEKTRVKGLNTLKILPLKAGGGIVGTLCLGAKRRGALHEDLVRTLEMLADQIGQSVLRAQLFDSMERMATTDGLTGLLNHRTMQTRLDELVGLANRYEKKLSFLLTDIDHFKNVNDTYGHPIGDVVLKGVAKILRTTARDTDIVARYGGEEFCVIMPETDSAGAKVMAERIRKEVEATTFETEQGPLKVTLSLGIATFPEAGRQKQQIIDRADQCLYFAKRNGRNRSVTAAEAARAAA